jgi:hypothetical protein
MVFAIARPITVPAPVGPPASTEAPSGPRQPCPRCAGALATTYYEPECLQCGYADYESTPVGANGGNKSLIATATKFVLRYVGDSPMLADTLTYVQLKRLRNRVVYGVRCPFCSGSMEQSALSGKRKEVREERYKCDDGHRVSLMPDRSGALGWK